MGKLDIRPPQYIPPGCTWDRDRVRLVVDFAECLRWPSGEFAGKRVEFAQFQMDDLISPAFGLIGPDGRRVIRQVMMLIARGNGKTGLMEVVAWYMFLADGEPAPHIDLFAADAKEAGKIFDSMAAVVYNDSELRDMLSVLESDQMIKCPGNLGRVKVATGSAKKELGGRPHCIIFDELLQQSSDKLFDAARTGLGKRPQPMMLSATTGSAESEIFAEDEVDLARIIAKDRSLDPSYLPILYECDVDADPGDEEQWHNASPALAEGFLSINTLRSEYAQALIKPRKMIAFKWSRLNQFGSGMSQFIDEAAWAALAEPPDMETLSTWWCYGGLDLSINTDLTSLCWLWWDGDTSGGRYYALWRHWSTRRMLTRLNQLTSGSFEKWAAHPSVAFTATDAPAIDYEDVNGKLLKDAKAYNPWQVGIDKYNAGHTITKLETAGVPWDNCMQGYGLRAGVMFLDSMIDNGALKHNGDLVAAWAAKVLKVKYNSDNQPKFIRPPSNLTAERIDPMSALAMAVDRHLKHVRETPEEERQFMLVTAADILDAIDAGDEDEAPAGKAGAEYEDEITRG